MSLADRDVEDDLDDEPRMVHPPGTNPRVSARDELLDYRWDEKTGVAKFKYRRLGAASEREIIDVAQPTSSEHVGWPRQLEIVDDNRAAILARYYESVRVQLRMQEQGAYER